MISSCFKDKVALLVSHDPVAFVWSGFRFINSWTVCQNRQRYIWFIWGLLWTVDWYLLVILLGVVIACKILFYLILRSRKIGDVELQSHVSQETCSVVLVFYKVRALFRCSWRGWCWSYGCSGAGSGRWSCSTDFICHTCTFCDKRNKEETWNQQGKKPWNQPACKQKHNQIRTWWTQVISWHVRLQPHVRESDSFSTDSKSAGTYTAVGGVDRCPDPNWRWHHGDHI